MEFIQHILDAVGDLDGVTAGELIDRDPHRGSLQVHGVDRNLTAQLNPANILQTHQTASIRAAQHDVFKFLNAGQTTLQLHREGVFLPLGVQARRRSCWQAPTVLTAQLVDHIGVREVVCSQLLINQSRKAILRLPKQVTSPRPSPV